MQESSNQLWVTYKELVENSGGPAELVNTFGDYLSWTPADQSKTITTDNTNGDHISISTGGSTNPNVTISPGGSPSWWVPVTPGPGYVQPEEWNMVETRAVELSPESRLLLERVEEKLDALLGKHPFARMANLRKALDEILAELNNDARYEGMERQRLPNGLEGWQAKYSYAVGSGRGFISSGIMPTENEALAQLIRLSQG